MFRRPMVAVVAAGVSLIYCNTISYVSGLNGLWLASFMFTVEKYQAVLASLAASPASIARSTTDEILAIASDLKSEW